MVVGFPFFFLLYFWSFVISFHGGTHRHPRDKELQHPDCISGFILEVKGRCLPKSLSVAELNSPKFCQKEKRKSVRRPFRVRTRRPECPLSAAA